MKITIDEDVCKKYNMTFPEVLAVLLVKSCNKVSEVFSSLEGKRILIRSSDDYLISQSYNDTVSSILLDSDDNRQSISRIEDLAVKMMDLFPKGKKQGTTQYFRGNKKDIMLRLKKFFKLYGDKYTDQQILNATEKYVNSFNGSYSYMRVLKYFIWKDERKVDSNGNSYVSEVSDLATYIENEADSDIDMDWTSVLK